MGAPVTIKGGAGATTTTGSSGGALTLQGGNAGGTAGGAGGIVTLQSGTSAGTNIAGANTVVNGGAGTGNAVGGNILFQYYTPGASGTTVSSTLQTACSISGTTGNLSCPGTGSGSERFGAGASTSTFTNALAVGNGASVTLANNGTAIGYGASAINGGTALGNAATAGGASALIATAVGSSAQATGDRAQAFGSGSSAAATGTTALGYVASAAGDNSIALGRSATTAAGNSGSIAIGYGVTTTAANQLVIGSNNNSYAITSAYIGSGVTNATPLGLTLQGTGSATAGTAGASVTLQSGVGTTTGAGSTGGVLTLQAGTAGGANIAGANTVINGGQGTGTGVGGNILFQYAAAGGAGSSANALQTACSISGTNGSLSCPGAGANSERFGAGATAGGVSSLAIGNGATIDTTLSGGASGVAIGQGASSSYRSVAVGQGSTNGTADGSVAIGRQASATGGGGVAIGISSTNAAQGGIALGMNTSIGGAHTGAVVVGNGATSTASNQLVIGSSTSNTYAITSAYIGNGVTNTAPLGFTLQGTGGSGADIAGASVNLAGGKGTGTGVGGNLNFQIAKPAGSTGSGLNTLSTVLSLSGTNGAALFQNATDSTTAFQIQQANAGSALNFDTTTNKLSIYRVSVPGHFISIYHDGRPRIDGNGSPVSFVSGIDSGLIVGRASAGAAIQTATLQGASSQTGDILRVKDASGNATAQLAPQAAGNQRLQFNLYNTLENTPTNYERLAQYADSTNNVFRIESQNGGTGTLRDLALQGAGGKVGIGTLTAGNLLSVGALTTASAGAQVAVSTSGATNSGIVVQTVAGQSSGNILQAQDSTGAALATIDYQGNLTVKAATINGTLTVNGQIATGGNAPTAPTANGAAGAGATCAITTGNETSGTITLTTGTGSSAGAGCTFTVSFASAPRPVVSGADQTSAALGPFMSSTTTTFTFGTNAAPADSTAYTFNYFNVR